MRFRNSLRREVVSWCALLSPPGALPFPPGFSGPAGFPRASGLGFLSWACGCSWISPLGWCFAPPPSFALASSPLRLCSLGSLGFLPLPGRVSRVPLGSPLWVSLGLWWSRVPLGSLRAPLGALFTRPVIWLWPQTDCPSSHVRHSQRLARVTNSSIGCASCHLR